MFMFHYHQICKTYVCVSLLPKLLCFVEHIFVEHMLCNIFVFLYYPLERKREHYYYYYYYLRFLTILVNHFWKFT